MNHDVEAEAQVYPWEHLIMMVKYIFLFLLIFSVTVVTLMFNISETSFV